MSEDGTRDILARLAGQDTRLRVIDNPGYVQAIGLNLAIRSSRGRIIIRMDVHTEYATDYVRECLAVLKETGADNVGGPWVAKPSGLVSEAIAAAFQSPFAVGGARSHDSGYEGPIDTVYLGCWRRELFDRLGFFDEELARNEDDEFNLRIVRAGGKIWQSPRIRSWYKPRGSLLALCRQYVQYGYWKVRVIQKHKMPASARHLVPGVFIVTLIALSLSSRWWPLAAWCWLALVGTYAVCNTIASIQTAIQRGWRLFPVLPLVFACFHFAYGYGFLRGVADFLMLGRRPDPRFATLTRSSLNRASE